MRISDWSSDLCSSDLADAVQRRRTGRVAMEPLPAEIGARRHVLGHGGKMGSEEDRLLRIPEQGTQNVAQRIYAAGRVEPAIEYRKSVGSGKRLSVIVNLRWRRSIKTKQNNNKQ